MSHSKALCPWCLSAARKIEQQFKGKTKYSGDNQHSLVYRWKGIDVTAIEKDILEALHHSDSPLTQRQLAAILYPEFAQEERWFHNVRRAIARLRAKLLGTRYAIENEKNGYVLRRKG